MVKMQIKIEELEMFIQKAKAAKERDSSLSEAIEFTLVERSETQGGSDSVSCWLNSSYTGCNGAFIGTNY